MKTKLALPIGRYLDLLHDYLGPQKKRVVILLLLLLGSIALQLVNPQIVRTFIDTAQAEQRGGMERLFGAAALFMAVAIARQVVNLLAVYIGENVAWTATNRLRADLALHCLRLDLSFHKTHTPGELIERVDGDVNQLANFFSQLVIRLGGNVLLVIGVMVLLWREDWRVGAAMTAVALSGLVALNWLNKRVIPRWQAVRQADAETFGFLEERLNGTEEIRSSGAVAYVMGRLYPLMRERLLRIQAAVRLNVFVQTLPIYVFALAYAAAHILGSTLFRDGTFTIGSVYIIFYYIDVIRDPLWQILRQVEDLQKATASINRIAELRAVEPTIHDGPGVPIAAGPLTVQFDNVSFHYEDDIETPILHDIKFTLAPGRVLGLLGRTGSGKSTLTRLLFRFYDPTAGTVRLGSRSINGSALFDIRDACQDDLRRHIGMVTQEVQLFRASLRHNLTLFDDSIGDNRILKAIADVGLSDWLAGLPDGLETRLEAGSHNLSAGEAQLLAFARVFLADPGLIILDEASSRLDPATEQRIEQALDRLLAGRTSIIVAHRLATVQRADEIMILKDGRILEHAPRAQLAADPTSYFYQLLQTGLEEVIA